MKPGAPASAREREARTRSMPARRVPAVVLGLIWTGTACGQTDIVLQDLPNEPVEMELAFGEERVITGTDRHVRFAAVEEDSRCPIDVTCVWEGNAAVRLALTVGDAPPHDVVLHTTLEPRSVEWNQVRVTLLEVRPERREEQPIPEEEYRARLRVEAAEGS